MTDSQSEVIQWWAEKVGWELAEKEHPRDDDFWRETLKIDGGYGWVQAWGPTTYRHHLHVLAGLAEDWLRERTEWLTLKVEHDKEPLAICTVDSPVYPESGIHEDWAIAKLLAFRSLAEKLPPLTQEGSK